MEGISKELLKLISEVDLTTKEEVQNFKNWQFNDGSVEGLKELLKNQQNNA